MHDNNDEDVELQAFLVEMAKERKTSGVIVHKL
jgi:hypothetical protein